MSANKTSIDVKCFIGKKQVNVNESTLTRIKNLGYKPSYNKKNNVLEFKLVKLSEKTGYSIDEHDNLTIEEDPITKSTRKKQEPVAVEEKTSEQKIDVYSEHKNSIDYKTDILDEKTFDSNFKKTTYYKNKEVIVYHSKLIPSMTLDDISLDEIKNYIINGLNTLTSLFPNSVIGCRLLQVNYEKKKRSSTLRMEHKNIEYILNSWYDKHNPDNNENGYEYAFNEIEFIVIKLGDKGGCNKMKIHKKRVIIDSDQY